MPEGDVVWLTARRLDQALGGQLLRRWDLRVPALATTDLTGHPVERVLARGKHLLIRIGPDWTLHTHFRMEGSWHLYPVGGRWRGGPDADVRAVLGTGSQVAVGYRLAVVELWRRNEEDPALSHLGPDLLGPDWELDQALERLRRDPAREIGMALLDQRNLAGLGNLYRTEACFLRGVNPWLAVGDVADLAALVELGRRLMLANRDSWLQSTTGMTRRGEQHWVFERAGRPCRRCGVLVRTARQGPPGLDRVTYWCPHCQPGQPRSG